MSIEAEIAIELDERDLEIVELGEAEVEAVYGAGHFTKL